MIALPFSNGSPVLGVPASSAAVERLFSGVGKDFAKQRQGVSEQTLEETTWVVTASNRNIRMRN